jgi:ubiquinone/menaquinone biosynthesis C-methylase UbiE
MHTDPLSTGYVGETAYKYDERRFSTRQGQLFSALEFGQLKRAVERLNPGSRVLEVGCGTGRFSEYMARHGFSVTGTDPSSDMVDIAAGRCRDLGQVRFRREEGAHLGYPNEAFDLVFAIRVTSQVESEAYALAMIREMIRVTRRGGLVLVEFINRDRPFPKRSRNVKLSFSQVERVAAEGCCDALWRHGVLVFSESVLHRMPDRLVPLWGRLERGAALGLWRWASRGYVALRKR